MDTSRDTDKQFSPHSPKRIVRNKVSPLDTIQYERKTPVWLMLFSATLRNCEFKIEMMLDYRKT